MVEFALVFPVAALLIFGIVILGVTVSNQLVLNTAVRNGARAAAICGSGTVATSSDVVTSGTDMTPTLPDGQWCTDGDVTAYINHQLSTVSGSLTGGIEVYDSSGTPSGSSVGSCSAGYTLEVTTEYSQPLYLPLVGYVLGNGATDTRSITATGEATCER